MSSRKKDKQEKKEAEKEPLDYWMPRTRCTKKEREAVNQKAASAGLTVSEYVRRSCIDGYIVQRQPIADIELIKELKRQGTNFNQYQHKLNALAKDSPAEVKRVSLRIETLLDTLQGF